MQSESKNEFLYLDNILTILYDNEKNPLNIHALFDKLYRVKTSFNPILHFEEKSIRLPSEDIFARKEYLNSELEKLGKALNFLLQENLISTSSNEFTVTYKGIVKSFLSEFEKEIGYENRVIELENNQKRTNKRMVLLTVILTIGTFISAVYSALQIYTFYCTESTPVLVQ